ncbi:MAG: phosphodiester glycosidase family protein, partial [Candidatus Nanopelagicales bacterium]
LSIPATAEVAQALGLRNALNLDGGGSTSMVLGNTVINSPSGAERAVGDALLILDQGSEPPPWAGSD